MSNENEPEEKHPWPVVGEKLFASTGDWQSNAWLKFSGDGKWNAYASGYKDAADLLVADVLKTRFGMDLLVFPIVFLYRHYLELRLKELIIEGSRLEDVPPDLENIHYLKALWKKARKLLEKIYPDDPTDVLNVVEEQIEEFELLDVKSMSFRYPVDTKGNPTLAGVQHINIRQFAKVMAGIAGLLDGASMGISVYHDYKSDMLGAGGQY